MADFHSFLWLSNIPVCVCVCVCVCVLCFLHCFKAKCEKFPLKSTLFPYPVGPHCRILKASKGRKKSKEVCLVNQ